MNVLDSLSTRTCSEVVDVMDKIKIWIRDGIAFFFSFFPVKNKVVFINFNGRGFGCNPKYIALEMIRESVDTEMIWFLRDIHDSMPSEIKKIKWGSPRFYYELATAKVIITNVKNALPFRKRTEQRLIQTWHGSNAYKHVEKEVENQLPSRYVAESKKNSALTDLFISDGPVTSQWYRDSFWCACEILESGMPRNDIFSNGTKELKRKIRETFNIDLQQKVLLYAPTFRDDGSRDCYQFDFGRLIDEVSKKFGGEWKLLLRLHPNVQQSLKIPDELRDSVIDACRYGDAQELIFASDALLTDYSSICNDFILMDKPVFLYVPDFKKYNQKGRGLKDNYYELPLTKNQTLEELIQSIRKFDFTSYQEDIANYRKKYLGISDGHASERVVKKIKGYLSDK